MAIGHPPPLRTKVVAKPRKPVVATKAKPVKAAKPTAFHVPMPPRPSYNAQQQSLLDAWNIVNPQIDAARSASLAQTNAGMGAIKGYTQFLANALSQYNPGDIYQRAQDTLAGINQNVQSSLAGAGSQLQGQLAQALSAINAPAATQQFAAQQGQIGAQSGATQLGLGSADLAAITKSRAAAENYAAQLPGIAGFAGLQSSRSLQLQQQASLQDTVNKLIAQVPQLQQQRYQDIKSNQAALATSKSKLAQQKFDNMLAAKAFGLKATTATSTAANNAAKLKQTAAQKAADRATRLAIAAANNATRKNIARANAAAKAAAAAQKRADNAAKTQAKQQSDRNKWFYAQRQKAITDAQSAFANGLTPAKVSAYLHNAYGAAMLGRGFTQAQVDQMIRKAVQAGRAYPSTGSKKTSGSKTGTFGAGGATGGLVP